MIKSFTAYTGEVDDVAGALAELNEQLGLEGNLLANTVGIVSCYAEFLDSGVVKALCESLPFEVVGTTTITCGTRGEYGDTGLSLLVLTSDDVRFATALTAPIPGEEAAPFEACYKEAAAKLPEKPVFMFSFSPLMQTVGTDFYVDTMSVITGNLPNFGTLAVDHNPDYHASQVIYGGEGYRDRYAIVLLSGNVAPKFFVGNVSDQKVFGEKAVVTAAHGNQLETVNGVSVVDYMQTLGLEKDENGQIAGSNAFPFIVDYNDGTQPVARAIFAFTPEGHAICGGNFPVGATLTVGAFDPEEIKATTRHTLQTALATPGAGVFLLYSCIGRYFALGYDPMAEIEEVTAMMKDTQRPYLMSVSGGEICPVYLKDGATLTRNHNNTFVVCAF